MTYEESLMTTPSPNVVNGRTPNGKFAPGWKGGPGNPFSKKTAALRSAFYSAVSQQDIRDVVAKLVEQAKAGSVPAARELFDRLFGKPDIKVDMHQTGTVLELVQEIIQVNHAAANPPQDDQAASNASCILPINKVV